MGHEKHLLEGVILESRDYGESGKILNILTKEYGVLSVSAQGVRDLQSKMRGGLEVLNLVNFEYVEGKEINRLVGIFPVKNLFPKNLKGKELLRGRKVISNIVNFVLRTVVGQARNEKLWNGFLEGFSQIEREFTSEDESKKYYQKVEIIWLIKILSTLGYFEEGRLDEFSESSFVYLDNEENKQRIVGEINHIIENTHL
jgi:DNA repair protein RecO